MTYKHDKLPPHVMELLAKRYFLRDEPYAAYYGEAGVEREWSQVARRVADVVAINNPARHEDYYNMMLRMQFLPNSPTLFGAGVPGLCMSACFVLPIEDSVEGWGEAIRDGLLVQTKGGGIGWPLHTLRPKGFPVSGKNAKAAGPLAFLRSWNSISTEFSQAVRSGANMGLLRVDHPDIEAFVEAKETDGDLATFNISVGITESFMAAVALDEDFPLKWAGVTVKTIKAKKLFERMCYLAWKNGDPGMVNLSRIQEDNLHPEEGQLYVNPCAEATLYPRGACNLGSVNVAAFVKAGEFMWDAFLLVVRNAYVFLDDLIDVNVYPTAEIKAMVQKFRQIGLGIMGLATAMLDLGLCYGTPDAEAFADEVFRRTREVADEMNRELAMERGAYPAANDMLRNSMMTTVAPTGSISMIAGVSSGIEPYFSFEPVERIIAGKKVIIKTPQSPNPELNVTANDLTVGAHIRIAEIAQRHVTMSVSKTINLPESATVKEVYDAYMLAFKKRLKGITVYRDGSRAGQVISEIKSSPLPEVGAAPTRPPRLAGDTFKERTGCGNLYVTMNRDTNDRIIEIFVRSGKLGGCAANIEGMGRLASTALRNGVPRQLIIKQLRGIICPSCVRTGAKVLSCPDALARMLETVEEVDMKKSPIETTEVDFAGDTVKPTIVPISLREEVSQIPANACPECGSPLVHEGGCAGCKACGYSKCGG